jgi:hypothetical protein
MAWVPLQRVLVPGYLVRAEEQGDMVRFLMAHGANPRSKLPFDPGKTVVSFAATIKSPMVAVLDAPPPAAAPATTLARSSLASEAGRASGGSARPPRDNGARAARPLAGLDAKATAEGERRAE